MDINKDVLKTEQKVEQTKKYFKIRIEIEENRKNIKKVDKNMEKVDKKLIRPINEAKKSKRDKQKWKKKWEGNKIDVKKNLK